MATAIKHVPYLEHDDATHSYFLDGELAVSITQVLQEEGVIDTDYFTEEHKRRGTLVHLLTELFDRDGAGSWETVEQYSQEEQGNAAKYAAQYIKLRENIPFVIEEGGIEEKVFDAVNVYAGRLDRRVIFNEKCISRALIEIKTNKSGYVPKWTGLQLAAQGHAKEPGELFRRFAFVLTPDSYKVHEFPIIDTAEEQGYVSARDTFLGMVRSVRWKRRFLWNR